MSEVRAERAWEPGGQKQSSVNRIDPRHGVGMWHWLVDKDRRQHLLSPRLLPSTSRFFLSTTMEGLRQA